MQQDQSLKDELLAEVDSITPILDYMTPNRLEWTYLRKLARATGEAMTLLDAYFFFSPERRGLKGLLRHHWWANLIKESLELKRRYSLNWFLRSFRHNDEGNDDVIHAEVRVGRLVGLLRLRSRYSLLHREIAQAPWRRTHVVHESVHS